ncbi:MAG: hypothetical protein H3Z49_04070 [archaeon]|nr:hypothetical protein [archaeon]
MPFTIGRLQVSERLILENAWEKYPSSDSQFFAFAYVGSEDESNHFTEAITYIDFFLLLRALLYNTVVTHKVGAATPISTLNDLGKKKVSFPKFKKANIEEDMNSELSKSILLTKEYFLKFEKDFQRIMGGYLGQALRYYFFALQTFDRGHLDEVLNNLAITAEVLFSNREKIKENLKCRLSSFIADDETERFEISKRIGDFYDLRSAIVHGGKKKITFNDVKIPSIYIQKAIDKALSSKLYLKEELIRNVDKKDSRY